MPNTNFYRAPAPYEHRHQGVRGRYCADRIAEAIEFEGPDTVAAVFLEPVQNAGGCFPPPPGYFERVREICDEYDVLLVSDEVICAYGRIGSMFACDDFGYVPDMITCAKGLTSGYSPIGAMIASDRLFEPFNDGKTTFGHGYTFGGHPVSSAVALANLDIFEREGINDHVKERAPAFRATLEKLYDLPIVGDVRGEGFFYGIELVKDKATKETFNDEESPSGCCAAILTPALFEAGLYCRADDRGDPVVQLAPPLISGQKEFDAIYEILTACSAKPAADVADAFERQQAADRSGPVAGATGRTRCRTSVRPRSRSCPFPGTRPRTWWSTPTGRIWTGLDRRPHRADSPEKAETRVVADTGGRPLGLHVARDGRLLICDSPRGLLAMDTGTGTIETLVDSVDGRRCGSARMSPKQLMAQSISPSRRARSATSTTWGRSSRRAGVAACSAAIPTARC